MHLWKRVASMCRKSAKLFIIGMIMVLLAIGTRLIMPMISGAMVDDVIKGGNLNLLWILVALILGLTVIRALLNFLRTMLLERVSQTFTYDLRTGLYNHLSGMAFRFFDQHRVGEIMSRMTGDIEGLRGLLAYGLVNMLECTLFLVGSLVFLMIISPLLTSVFIVMAPLLGWLAMLYSKRIGPAYREIREQNAALNTRAQENISGVRVVKAFAREDYEADEFAKDNEKQRDLNIRATYLASTYGPLIDIVGGLCQPIIMLIGGWMVLDGKLSLGDLIAYVGYIWMIVWPMRQTSGIINMLTQAYTSAEKLFYYLDLGSTIRDPETPRAAEPFKGHVRFENVEFSYGDGVVLKDININLPPGKTLAIMGATGSGKSTLAYLIARFYDVSSGSVSVDGIDVREWSMAKLRENIGYVMQETFLFSESIENNVRFGVSEAPLERSKLAAKRAQALDFIEETPAGWETIVGERGTGLSGGQKQRVAIARALCINPGILVFDDATSAVDMETEREIQMAMKEVMADRTTVIIAHRISSVKDADEIIVLDQGTILERGTHASLMALNGRYASMVHDQYRDYEAYTARKKGVAGDA